MGSRYSRQTYHQSSAMTTATDAQILVGPIDISDYEILCFGFQNQQTAATVLALHMQVNLADGTNASGASGAPNWVDINTAVVPWPSSIAASATVYTGPLTNAYRQIRILGGTTATANAGNFRLYIGGHTRKG